MKTNEEVKKKKKNSRRIKKSDNYETVLSSPPTTNLTYSNKVDKVDSTVEDNDSQVINDVPCDLKTSDRVLVERMLRRLERDATIDGFSEGEIIHVLDLVFAQLEPLPSLINVDVPAVIFGDLHGQYSDLERFLKIVGTPPKSKLLFLGDYVDRCKKGIEVVLLLFCYKLRFPGCVDMLRGNHECAKLNRIYGFYSECRHKISVRAWKAFQRAFDELPLCARVGGRILAMKPRNNFECDSGIALDLMWADPSRDDCTKGFQPNADRGTSYLFGDEVIKNFNNQLDIDLVVRAHEVVPNGHLFNANNQMCTIFSAPNYCGTDGNSASVLRVSSKLYVSFVTLKPKVDPSYAKNMTKEQVLEMKQRFDRANAKSPDPCNKIFLYNIYCNLDASEKASKNA